MRLPFSFSDRTSSKFTISEFINSGFESLPATMGATTKLSSSTTPTLSSDMICFYPGVATHGLISAQIGIKAARNLAVDARYHMTDNIRSVHFGVPLFRPASVTSSYSLFSLASVIG